MFKYFNIKKNILQKLEKNDTNFAIVPSLLWSFHDKKRSKQATDWLQPSYILEIFIDRQKKYSKKRNIILLRLL